MGQSCQYGAEGKSQSCAPRARCLAALQSSALVLRSASGGAARTGIQPPLRHRLDHLGRNAGKHHSAFAAADCLRAGDRSIHLGPVHRGHRPRPGAPPSPWWLERSRVRRVAARCRWGRGGSLSSAGPMMPRCAAFWPALAPIGVCPTKACPIPFACVLRHCPEPITRNGQTLPPAAAALQPLYAGVRGAPVVPRTISSAVTSTRVEGMSGSLMRSSSTRANRRPSFCGRTAIVVRGGVPTAAS